MKIFISIGFSLLLFVQSAQAQLQFDKSPVDVKLLSRVDGMNVAFSAETVDPAFVSKGGNSYQAFTLPGEGTTFELDRPILPSISRFVIVDPTAGLELFVEADSPVEIKSKFPPALCDEEKLTPTAGELTGLYPPNFAEISDPVIIRGVRMVKITTYPYQFDAATGNYLHRSHIKADIRYNDSPPINPVIHPRLPGRSPDFQKFLKAFAVNGEDYFRDNPDFPTPYTGHYLIVVHIDALIWHQPFIEWRRKAGYKVDIIALSANDASSPNTIKNAIQAKYNQYINAGQEPFDELLLIGDRNGYDNLTTAPDKQLAAERGETIWGGPDHADYKFALLEGNDQLPDVSFGRMPSGSQGIAGLVVGRTLAYEMAPRMQNPQWFTRGLNYSQHWGNGVESAWHITIHTNARWGEEVLKSLGFDDVNFYEDQNWDQQGNSIGPVIRDELNAGSNLLVGRAENYYWRNSFQGVDANTVFPINICVSGHGEWTAWNMFRTGAGNNLKGPVAATFGWGGPPTATSSYLWMQMVNGTLQKEMSLGWSRMYAITSIERFFPNFNVGQQMYGHVKTDIDMHGDPGIRPWFGVPRQLQFTMPQSVSPDVNMIEARLTTVQGGNPAPGVQVTLYHERNMPFNNAGQYAAYIDIIRKIAYTDDNGVVRFSLDSEVLIAGKPLYITATGRDVRPVLGQIAVSVPSATIELLSLGEDDIVEIDGDGDDIPNPTEVIDVTLHAKNFGNRDAVAGVTAVVTSLSPFLEVVQNQITFGDINSGAEVEGDEPVRVTLSPRCPDSGSRPLLQPQLLVTFTSGNSTWKSILNLPTEAPHFTLRSIVGGNVVPTRATNLDLDLNNVGSLSSGNMTARLSSLGIGVTVIRETANFRNIAAVNGHAQIQGNPFLVSGNQIVVPGSTCPMLLVLSNDAGFSDTLSFTLQVGTIRANAPQGPDAYGYIAFDDTDQDWEIAPTYEWVEINPNDQAAEFDGSLLNFRWQGEIGEAIGVNLGFETQFYGKRFNRVTVASNGFISMGNQPRITNHQNWPLDQAIGGGVGMIAPFWDDLKNGQGSGIYSYYDEENGRHIIEWYRMRANDGNPEFTFQVILYDADVWLTESGDPNILFQYKTLSEDPNLRNGDTEWTNAINFASIGISSPEGNTGLSYHFHGDGPVTSADLAARRAILFSTAPRFKNGTLYGHVTDAETGEPVANATIFTQHGFVNTTDEDGNYRISGAPAEIDFIVTCRQLGYNDSTYIDKWIDEGDSLEVNFDLLHPEFAPSIERIDEAVSADELVESQFTVTNTGNGTLSWQVTRRLVGDANAAPWELRRELLATQITGDTRITGVVFAEDRFYLAGANVGEAGNGANMIWVVDRDGALVDSFEQHGISNFGYKDIDYDGELIWASGNIREDDVYGFDLDGRIVKQWHCNEIPGNFAWDKESGALFVSTTTSDIFRYDRDGNNLGQALPRNGLRIYGLGFWPDDADGHQLYVVNRPVNDTTIVSKVRTDPANTDPTEVLMLPTLPINATRAGAFVTNEYDVYSWVFMTVTNETEANGGDKVEIYQLDSRRDWFDVQPESGTLAAGEEQTFDFTFNSADLPNVVFEGELYFTHNAAGNRAIIPVVLEVQAGPGRVDRRTIELVAGWNIVSLNIDPEEDGVPGVVAPLVEQDLLRIVKDGQGRFYRPQNNFNNIPSWDPANGYLFYLDQASQLNVRGVVIAADEPINLNAGWNLRSYYPRDPHDVRDAVANVVESLALVKDGSGHFYMPALGFNNMEPMEEGRGYYFRATAAAVLIYPGDEDRVAVSPSKLQECIHFAANNSLATENHTLLVLSDPAFSGYEVAAMADNGVIAGAGMFDATGRAGVAIWGDDPTTADIEGAGPGSPIRLSLWDGFAESSVSISRIDGDQVWTSGGISVATLGNPLPIEFGLTEAFPNPFNNSICISYGVMEAGKVRLAIYDGNGRQVTLLSDDLKPAGLHKISWTANGLPNGIYFAKIEQAGMSDVKKLFLIK